MSYSLLEKVKIRLGQYTVEHNPSGDIVVFTETDKNILIEELIEKAKVDIAKNRNYPKYYTEEMRAEDIEKNYLGTLMDLVLFDYYADGMDYETNHSENGVNRTMIKRELIVGDVTPFATIL